MAHHHGSPFDHAEKDTPVRRTASFILAGLSGGHGIFHWFNQSFLVMLPDIQDAFGLSKVQVGAITATREIAGGPGDAAQRDYPGRSQAVLGRGPEPVHAGVRAGVDPHGAFADLPGDTGRHGHSVGGEFHLAPAGDGRALPPFRASERGRRCHFTG